MASTVWADGIFGDCSNHMMGSGMFGLLIMILFWVAVIYLIYLAIKRLVEPRDSALDILKKKYVKGQISKKKFEEMKKDLKKK